MFKISDVQFWKLIRLGMSNLKNPLTSEEVSKIIEISRTNPYYVKFRLLLCKNGIAYEKRIYSNTKLLVVNMKKLENFIKKTKQFKQIKQYVKKKDPFFYAIE